MNVAQGRGVGVFGSFGEMPVDSNTGDLPLADLSGQWVGNAPTSGKSVASKALLFASGALVVVGVVMAVRGK